ncbi:MAG TPA: tetratricopeptide repeat protein [Verrucomicrobiae bacterium]|nr:tetratricopeptide repeat protein [Verrucomicrobiae bacterium]
MDKNVPELTISDRFVAWYDANKQQALLGVLILILVGIGFGYLVWHSSEKDMEAGEALTSVTLAHANAGGGLNAGAHDALLKVANEYPNSKAGARARLLAAGNLFVDAKYDQARAEFEKFTRDYKDSPYLGEALLGIAACYDAQGKTNEAVSAYNNFIEHHAGEPGIPQAKFSLARLYEGQGKPDKAQLLYTDVERAEPGSTLGTEAGMRVEELKQKFPNLASVTIPASTNLLQIK